MRRHIDGLESNAAILNHHSLLPVAHPVSSVIELLEFDLATTDVYRVLALFASFVHDSVDDLNAVTVLHKIVCFTGREYLHAATGPPVVLCKHRLLRLLLRHDQPRRTHDESNNLIKLYIDRVANTC